MKKNINGLLPITTVEEVKITMPTKEDRYHLTGMQIAHLEVIVEDYAKNNNESGRPYVERETLSCIIPSGWECIGAAAEPCWLNHESDEIYMTLTVLNPDTMECRVLHGYLDMMLCMNSSELLECCTLLPTK